MVLAAQLGLGVAASKWFLAECDLEVPGISFDREDAGMLLEKLDDAEGVDLAELAAKDPGMTARIIAFFVLDRGEPPGVWRARGSLCLIDLELIMARFVSRAEHRRTRLDEYADMSTNALGLASQEAERCGVYSAFATELLALRKRVEEGTIIFDFHPHRRCDVIVAFLLQSLRLRLEIVARALAPQRKSPP